MRIIVFHALHVYFVYQENMHTLQLSPFVRIAHELCHFWEKHCAKSVNQVRLVKDMHVKYREDNLHCMTWYTGTCGSNGHGLTIHVSFMVKCVRYVRAVDPLVS
jgi:hypothetical protein